jgi:hypothetical protein
MDNASISSVFFSFLPLGYLNEGLRSAKERCAAEIGLAFLSSGYLWPSKDIFPKGYDDHYVALFRLSPT